MRRLAALALAALLVALPNAAHAATYADPEGDVKVDGGPLRPTADQVASVDLVGLEVRRAGAGLRMVVRFAGPPSGGLFYPFLNVGVDEPSRPVSRWWVWVSGQPVRGTGVAYYRADPRADNPVRCKVELRQRGSVVRIDVPRRCTPPRGAGRAVVSADTSLVERGVADDRAAHDEVRSPGAPGIG